MKCFVCILTFLALTLGQTAVSASTEANMLRQRQLQFQNGQPGLSPQGNGIGGPWAAGPQGNMGNRPGFPMNGSPQGFQMNGSPQGFQMNGSPQGFPMNGGGVSMTGNGANGAEGLVDPSLTENGAAASLPEETQAASTTTSEAPGAATVVPPTTPIVADPNAPATIGENQPTIMVLLPDFLVSGSSSGFVDVGSSEKTDSPSAGGENEATSAAAHVNLQWTTIATMALSVAVLGMTA
ncbi:hypothetical protein Poli38472_004297 [Pythium oligandrum]|uniref:Uncharacterized protein n=1 Tax=Pythium oligandrum TaxID=41045 RepID=A0A8K1CMZ4_PYTOL|nr:hypothetical protein Poli38472_004297 [Pythium oligandrum]|eukprot:TMW66532.1 hypothetical protein Poli38472_004297 [Pythium oligandrum]